jgi:hypothetical protein
LGARSSLATARAWLKGRSQLMHLVALLSNTNAQPGQNH